MGSRRNYLWLFERVRNGFFIGFVYVAIGLLLSKIKTKLKDGIIPFIIGFISYYFNIEIGLILFATGAFIIVINLNIKEFKCYKFLNYTKYPCKLASVFCIIKIK